MIIVAALLERGDVFIGHGRKLLVTRVGANHIYCRSNGGRCIEISMDSKQKLTLVKDGDVGDIENLGKLIHGEYTKEVRQYKKRERKPTIFSRYRKSY